MLLAGCSSAVDGMGQRSGADDPRPLQQFLPTADEVGTVVGNPLIEAGQRDAVLKDIASRLGLSPLATNAVRYLASRRRLPALAEIARRLGSLADEKAGVLRASVTSAGPTSGTTMLHRIRRWEAPSTKAASYNSWGIASM